ncbi:helix-turn-helix domain-containing protein [Streptomyces sp. NPDC088182]|uniref:helix-turn-helix domain-containing protein n=1 Tax=Streptomyces sp. NPDC088182 TaxID=3365838 RepID=UPI00380605FF
MPLSPGRRRAAIGEQIRAARIHANLSQQTVAQRVGMTLDNYGRIERGQVSPTPDTLLGIADAINVPLAHLVREAPPTSEPG